jgi:hypothetical protein
VDTSVEHNGHELLWDCHCAQLASRNAVSLTSIGPAAMTPGVSGSRGPVPDTPPRSSMVVTEGLMGTDRPLNITRMRGSKNRRCSGSRLNGGREMRVRATLLSRYDRKLTALCALEDCAWRLF